MRKLLCITLTTLLVMGLAVSAFAHSGSYNLDEFGEPIGQEIEIIGASATGTHDETVGNDQNWYKGWWFVTLTNSTGFDWASVKIEAGVGSQVAIVEGIGLQDEFGFISNSVVSNKPGAAVYAGSYGPRTYNFGGSDIEADLWQSVVYTFNAPVVNGQKAAFKVYTDNSYYGDPATSFSLTITPNAVPEPSSFAAMGASLVGFAGFAWRRRK